MEIRINMAFIIVDSFGFAELPKFMMILEGKQNEIQTELAVHIADRYILMHECDEGYDYSIMDEQYYRDEFLWGACPFFVKLLCSSFYGGWYDFLCGNSR